MPRTTHAVRRVVAVTTVAGVMVTATACSSTRSTPAASTASSTSTAAGSPSAATLTGTVWVANEESGTLSVINAATNTVATTVTGIPGPHNVQASADGSAVFAVSGENSAVVSLDPKTYKTTGTAATGAMPAHVVVSPDGGRAYVTSNTQNQLDVYTTHPLAMTRTIDVALGPHGLRPTTEGRTLVVADVTGDAISLVDATTNKVTATIPVGDTATQVAVDPNNKYAYVSLNVPKKVVKVDLAARKVIGSTSVPAPPVQLYITADGTKLLSANQGTKEAPGHDVSVIDPTTMKVTASIPTGKGPHGVVIDPSGRDAWVTNTFDDTVSRLDLASNTQVATIPVGKSPNGISFSPLAPAPAPANVAITVPNHASGSASGMDGMPGMDHGGSAPSAGATDSGTMPGMGGGAADPGNTATGGTMPGMGGGQAVDGGSPAPSPSNR